MIIQIFTEVSVVRKWTDMFIIQKQVREEWFQRLFLLKEVKKTEVFALIDIASGEVVGDYKDWKYAASRARYKFKQRIHKIEKILLGG